MLRPTSIAAALAAFCLAVLAATAAHADPQRAGPKKDQFFISLLGAYYEAPGGFNITQEDVGYGGGIGWSFADHWAVEGQMFRISPDARVGAARGDVDIDYWTLNALHILPGGNAWSPYLTFGGGRGKFDYDGLRRDTRQNMYNAGIGFFGQLGDHFALRGDVRGVYHHQQGGVRPMATLGFSLLLGSAAPAAAPAPAAPLDSDGDGVPDDRDACLGTPAGVAVDERGCPLDSDGDGVPDYLDECPGTPAGARVDARGCEIQVTEPVSFNLTVEFAFDSAEITAVSFQELMAAIRFLREHPSTTAVVEGHTDNRGSAAYNQSLSERRADAVRTAIANSGIAADRLSTRGYGLSRPIASNDTDEGRQANRRVTVVVSGTETR